MIILSIMVMYYILYYYSIIFLNYLTSTLCIFLIYSEISYFIFLGLTPMCENMPGSNSLKPGDVITAMNGKSIQVDNTDAEGRLILADALCYAAKFKPKITLDMATLTGKL